MMIKMTIEEVQAAVRPVLDSIKAESFEGYQASDAEAMGLLVSKVFRWDGLQILRAAQYATEDANFHTESGLISEMADRVEAS